MENQYILAVDQGTSSTKCLLFDAKGAVVAKASVALKTHYLDAGFVEQEPEAIYQNVLDAVKNCIDNFGNDGGKIDQIRFCGISNQRETFMVWDKNGNPLYDAVVWQCKRSISVCEDLKKAGLEPMIKERTGLIIDPYFSGTKMVWLLKNNERVKVAVNRGEAFFGTVDTWLLYKLTNGAAYFTDHTNASRTLFFNLQTLDWDRDILEAMGLCKLNLPQIKASSAFYGYSDFGGIFSEPLSITAMVGDSHAAAFGEGCFEPGTAKATLGTGCSILMNIGNTPKKSDNGMVTTICWSTEDRVDYALEGVIVSCGATLEWIKNELGLFKEIAETELMANAVTDNNGVYLVPAFSGLGAPHWQMDRRAEIVGLTFDCNKNHVIRAALESIPYQIKDVVTAMQTDAGLNLAELMVHGGITNNRFVLSFLADQLNCNLICSPMPDISAKGAALLAGLKGGVFKDIAQIKAQYNKNAVVDKGQFNAIAEINYEGWRKAILEGRKA